MTTAEHGVEKLDDTVAPHRWTRYTDPDTGETNHWCVDGCPNEHHPEPCADAATGAGDHADDVDPIEEWPVFEPLFS